MLMKGGEKCSSCWRRGILVSWRCGRSRIQVPSDRMDGNATFEEERQEYRQGGPSWGLEESLPEGCSWEEKKLMRGNVNWVGVTTSAVKGGNLRLQARGLQVYRFQVAG